MLKYTLLTAVAGMAFLASAQAQLAHRYDLTTVNDTPANGFTAANGTLAGTATLANGMLVTTGATGQSLTLPASVGTGITGSFSLELYATATGGTSPDFSSIFSFATAQTNFILFNPNRGGAGNNSVADFRQAGITPGGNEYNLDAGSKLLADAAQHQIVLTYTAATGAVSIYNNGALAASGNAGIGFNFQTVSNGTFDGIGGNGPYGDPSFNGSIADFRIYTSALNATQVGRLNTAGANATNAQIATALVPEPSTWTAALAGVAALVGLQRIRRSVA